MSFFFPQPESKNVAPELLAFSIGLGTAWHNPRPRVAGAESDVGYPDRERPLPGNRLKGLFARPYTNVIRMHVLIFFFAGAHFVGLESIWVFGVVYLVYFFPWRLLKKTSTEKDPVPA